MNFFNDLPEDIIDRIYKFVHEIKFKDVLNEIENVAETPVIEMYTIIINEHNANIPDYFNFANEFYNCTYWSMNAM